MAPDKNLRAGVPFQYGFVTFYDFSITEKWQTSLGYSETVLDNTEGQLDNSFHRSQYAVGQLIYKVIPNRLLVGLNFQCGKKYNKDDKTGDDQRILFNVTYQFSMVH